MGRRAARGPRSGGSVRGYQRVDRLNELLVRILAEELERIDDDRLGFVTVTGVETDQDPVSYTHLTLPTTPYV